MLYLIAGSGLVALAIVLAIVFLAGGGDGGRASCARGRRLHAAELPGAGERVRPLRRADARRRSRSGTPRRRRAGRTTARRRSGASTTSRSRSSRRRTTSSTAASSSTTARTFRRPRSTRFAPGTTRPTTRTGSSSRRSRRTRTRSRSPPGLPRTPRPAREDRGRGWLATCTTFDEGAFSAFVDEHRYKGPERIPPELLAPGS